MPLQKLIDEALAKKQKEREAREPSGMISPSSFGYCFRRQYWQRLGEPVSNPFDERQLRVFACGNLFHDFVQQFIPEGKEVEVKKDDISGRADVVTEDYVYDIKTMHSKGFFYLRKNCDISKEREGSWLQVACYAMILNKPKIGLVIISKDDLCINDYADLTEKWVEKVNNELTIIRENWEKKELPKALPRAYGSSKLGDKECGYCGYKDKCFKLENFEN